VDQKIIELKHALEQRIGFTINSIQRCKQLDTWLKEYNIFISYSTLSRIFGFNKNGVIPRQRTLDLLCSVIGYSNYESFLSRELPFIPHVLYKTENSFQLDFLLDSGLYREAVDFFLDCISKNRNNSYLSLALGKALYQRQASVKKELHLLAENPLGREYFYQHYIDEDDLTLGYFHSLDEHFSMGANTNELFFIELYKARKILLRKERLSEEFWIFCHSHLSTSNSLHINSRYWEICILNEYVEKKKVTVNTIQNIINSASELLNVRLFGLIEYAVVGRICRAMILTDSWRYLEKDSVWINHCRQVVLGSHTDIEFQSATYCFLKLVCIDIPQLDLSSRLHWPNAYFTSNLFLQNPILIRKAMSFYQSHLRIHNDYLSNLLESCSKETNASL
jgi:hypothetical protein